MIFIGKTNLILLMLLEKATTTGAWIAGRDLRLFYLGLAPSLWPFSYVNFYGRMAGLCEYGWAESSDDTDEDGKRRSFRITDKGRKYVAFEGFPQE